MFGAALIGWFANQYMSHRTELKTALNQNYEQFDVASDQVKDSLRLFSEIAVGKKAKSQDDVALLQQRLVKAVDIAQDLQRRLGNDDLATGYAHAAVRLKKASDTVTGPLDAKPLVEAVSDYLVAEKTVRDAIVREHNSFMF